MSGERAHDVIEQLTYEHDPLTTAHHVQKFLGGFFANLWLENVLEIFLTQEIQAIETDSPQQSMKKASSKSAAGGVCEWPSHRHQRHASSTCPALRKALRIPRKKADRPQRAEFQERSFHAPINRLGRRRGGCSLLRIGRETVHWDQLRFCGNHTGAGLQSRANTMGTHTTNMTW